MSNRNGIHKPPSPLTVTPEWLAGWKARGEADEKAVKPLVENDWNGGKVINAIRGSKP
jgi:hypothetical protein